MPHGPILQALSPTLMLRSLAIAGVVALIAAHGQATMLRRPPGPFDVVPASVIDTTTRHLQTSGTNNETLVCPAGDDRLAQEPWPVLTTLCPVQCAADNLCIYYPANATSACTTTTGRQCVQGSTCAFECVAKPSGETGWFLTLYTEENVIYDMTNWNVVRPKDVPYSGDSVAINASVVRKFVGGFNPSISSNALYITGNEAANNFDEQNYFGIDSKVFPRGELLPFDVPATLYESLQGFQRIRLENLRFNAPRSDVSIKFPALIELYVRNTGLTSVPFINASCPLLDSLDLSMNQISEVTELPNINGLKAVNLSFNALTSIPKNIFTPTTFYLAVASNPLKEIPLGTLPPTIQSLTISDTMLTEVPGDIANMLTLADLYMNDNPFKTIPENSLPVEMTYLVKINNCSLTSIPKALAPMKQLQKLFMDDNDFSENLDLSVIPASVILLEMRNCKMQTFGGGLQLPRGLQLLDVSGNPKIMNDLSDIPADLIYLLLIDNGLTRLPPVMSKLKNLLGLDLQKNPLEKIEPGEISSTLSEVWMSDAKFRSLERNTFPSTVTFFSLDGSLLEEAPEDFRSMTKLQSLFIARSRLQTFDVADNLPALEKIQLPGNQLSRFAGSFTAATILDLSYNQIEKFNVASAPNLEILQLGYNNLSSMPAAIFDLPKLETLNLTGNPIRNFSPTADQINFLTKIPNLRMNQEMFTTDCEDTNKARLRTFTVCSSVAPAAEAQVKASSSKTSVALIVGNTLLGLVLCVLVFVWWRRRQRHKQREKELTNQTASLGEHLLDESIWSDTTLLQHRLDITKLQDKRLLGSGVNGEVWLASYRSELVAVKKLTRTDAGLLQQFVTEIKLVLTLSHPRLVDIIGVVWTKESDLALVIEYMAGGDLRSYLDTTTKTHDSWTSQELQLALEITEAVVYLHSLDPIVIHRDLKSRNVLLDAEGHAKITDFGISRLLTENETMTANVGTMRWIAPEVLAGKRYSESADIYSLGVILSEIDTHKLPFEGALDETGTQMLSDSALASRLVSGLLKFTFSGSGPAEIRSLVERCTAFDPEERPTGLQIAYELRTLLRKK